LQETYDTVNPMCYVENLPPTVIFSMFFMPPYTYCSTTHGLKHTAVEQKTTKCIF